MNEEKKLTGYPSIDKPWLKYYSEEAINGEIPKRTLYGNIYSANSGRLNETAIEYYGAKITYKTLFEKIKKSAH